jgi:hypothetical protein
MIKRSSHSGRFMVHIEVGHHDLSILKKSKEKKLVRRTQFRIGDRAIMMKPI